MQMSHNSAATVFAVGVGRYNEKELIAVASDPVCTHMLLLQDFTHIQSIVTEIQKSTCEGMSLLCIEHRFLYRV